MILEDDWTFEERLAEADKCLTEAMEDARQTHRMRMRVAELVLAQTPDSVTQKTEYEWEALEQRRTDLVRSALYKVSRAGDLTMYMDTTRLRQAKAAMQKRQSIIRAVLKASE